MTQRSRELTELTAAELVRLMSEGTVLAQAVTEAHLERIGEEDEATGAWVHLDSRFAIEQARQLDRHRKAGHAIGPLHGVPVGIKDIVDVRGLPCENGTPLDAGRRATEDAFLVTRLREAGAVILGKTVTTELAYFSPGKTRNPHDRERTPGGSSSGSAAAVAAYTAPLAVGSQTNGSIIRPASYCGVVGMKPSRGTISRSGVISQSPTLDTMGGFARSVEDIALLIDGMAGYDEKDTAMRLLPRPRCHSTAMSRPPLPPTFAFVKSPVWNEAEQDVKDGFTELVGELGATVHEVELPEPFQRGVDLHKAIHLADIAKSYGPYYEKDASQLSAVMRETIEAGRKVLAVDYSLAHDWIEILNAALDRLFLRYEAIITPAAVGEAHKGLETTGSPIFSSLWTLCGVPAVSLPLLTGSNGMPIGVQLVGQRDRDGRLLRTARWLIDELNASLSRDVT